MTEPQDLHAHRGESAHGERQAGQRERDVQRPAVGLKASLNASTVRLKADTTYVGRFADGVTPIVRSVRLQPDRWPDL